MSPDLLDEARQAWQEFCRRLDATGQEALAKSVVPGELDLAEGLRYLTRIACLCLEARMENTDGAHPYIARNIGPIRKLGGDNPHGLYLDTPIDGRDTYRIRGQKGSAGWASFQIQRCHAALGKGLSIFGGHLLLPALQTDAQGRFEIGVGPEPQAGQWIQSDDYSEVMVIRQFFNDPDDVRPMDLSIENLSRGHTPKRPLTLADASQKLAGAGQLFQLMVPVMQQMMRSNRERSLNCFETADGGGVSVGGVPGGIPVTGFWQLAEDEALVMDVMPPADCPYWDVQVGNGWYESFDYRHFISGSSDRETERNADGSVTLVLSERDPGRVNWLECAGHREGHMAIRWQAIAGAPPAPRCRVVKIAELARHAGHLREVSAAERAQQRRRRRRAVDARFRL
jgi:Protein of unknown function (DUF1214)